jgi:hypothetical protein
MLQPDDLNSPFTVTGVPFTTSVKPTLALPDVRSEHVAAEDLAADVGLVAVADALVGGIVGHADRAADVRPDLRKSGAARQGRGDDGCSKQTFHGTLFFV